MGPVWQGASGVCGSKDNFWREDFEGFEGF